VEGGRLFCGVGGRFYFVGGGLFQYWVLRGLCEGVIGVLWGVGGGSVI